MPARNRGLPPIGGWTKKGDSPVPSEKILGHKEITLGGGHKKAPGRGTCEEGGKKKT